MTNQNEKRMKKKAVCDSCKHQKCRDGKDCFHLQDMILPEYRGEKLRLTQVAAGIEAEFYLRKNRLEELILFAKRMKYQKLGIAFCIGLIDEAKILGNFLRRDFEVVSICCKVSGIDKDQLHLDKMQPETHESMCNPLGQATILNRHDTDLNIICGLCIGHDILFTQQSRAPVTTFIVKDRMLAHNTVASLTCPYLRKRMIGD